MLPTVRTRRTHWIATAWMTCALMSALAGDWPSWRGPTRTGRPAANEPVLTQLPSAPHVVWSIAAGPGYASPIVAEGLVFAMEAQEGKEVLRALEAASGAERWKAIVDETFTDS